MMFLRLENMCTPVILSFLIGIARFIVNLINKNVLSGFKILGSSFVFTLFLNVLCSYNYYKTAWVFFLIPIFIFIILNILLITIYKRSEKMNDTVKNYLPSND